MGEVMFFLIYIFNFIHILRESTAAFIFVFYVIFVLAIMYYFLHGMVAMDGICGGKR